MEYKKVYLLNGVLNAVLRSNVRYTGLSVTADGLDLSYGNEVGSSENVACEHTQIPV